MLQPLLRFAQSRSRSEWDAILREWWTNRRIWVQENPEKAFIVGFLGGVLSIILLRIVLAIVLLALTAYAILWTVAPEGVEPAKSE